MKRHESLRPLSREHHESLILARLLRKDAPPFKGLPDSLEGKVLYACEIFNHQLKAHFLHEEKIFSSLVKFHPTIIEMLETIRLEHQKLIELFSNLAAGIYTPDTLDEFGHYLESHIRKEERQFFPFIESNFPESALNALL